MFRWRNPPNWLKGQRERGSSEFLSNNPWPDILAQGEVDARFRGLGGTLCLSRVYQYTCEQLRLLHDRAHKDA